MMNALPSVPRQIFVPDPLLGWRLSPNKRLNVQFRPEITHTTDADGWRSVVGQPDAPTATVGFYGCSFTYGTALDDGETFTSQLQDRFRDVRILNRGVGGYSTVQSYLQLREDIADRQVDAAIFAVIGDHKYRNKPHPMRLKGFQTLDWCRAGAEHYPCAISKAGGGVDIHYVPMWQPALRWDDLGAFLPDEIMLNRLTADVLTEVTTFVRDTHIPFYIVLLDDIDDTFNRTLLDAFDCVTDISTPHDAEHRFLPHDLHPNVNAARLYAKRLRPIIVTLLEQAAAR